MDDTRIDIASARAGLASIITRATAGQTFIVTRYGKEVARIVGIDTQVEHGAAAPTHRPAPEALEVRGTGTSSYADRHPAQAARDAILGGARKRIREERR